VRPSWHRRDDHVQLRAGHGADLLDRLAQIALADDRIAPVDGLGLVADELHRHAARDPGALEATDGGAAEVMDEQARQPPLDDLPVGEPPLDDAVRDADRADGRVPPLAERAQRPFFRVKTKPSPSTLSATTLVRLFAAYGLRAAYPCSQSHGDVRPSDAEKQIISKAWHSRISDGAENVQHANI
jgi:hypothetical protein